MPGKRQAKKSGKRYARRKTAPKAITKVVKAIAKNEAEKLIETKYKMSVNQYAYSSGVTSVGILTNTAVSQFSASPATTGILQSVIPSLTRGDGTDEIVGSRVQMVGGKTDFRFYIPATLPNAVDVVVKLYCLESRSIRDYSKMSTLPPNKLLRVGFDTTQDWQPSVAITAQVPIYDMLEVNKSSFKVHHVKTFRLTKNYGLIQGGVDSVAPSTGPGSNAVDFTWNWGRNMKLKYEDRELSAPASCNATNYAPVWCAVAYYADNTAPGNDNTQMPVNMISINHFYYKDA